MVAAAAEPSHSSSSYSRVVRGGPEVTPAAPTSPPPPESSDRSPTKAAALDDRPPGGSPDPVGTPALPSPSDGADQGGGNAASSRGKKPAWSRPANGVVEVGLVMGAVSWPALSEAAKASPRSWSSDSLKGLVSDGSTDAPTIADDTKFCSSSNHGSPTRQKPVKRGGSSGSGGTVAPSDDGAVANGGAGSASLLPTSVEVAEDALEKPVTMQASSRDLSNRNSSNWDRGSRGGGSSPQSQGGNEHPRNFGGYRRGNNSGGSPHRNNFANRRGQERGGYEWNNRSFSGGRDVQVQQQQQQQQPRATARPFLWPVSPISAPFISPPPPVRPFASHMGYYDVPSPLFYVPTHAPPEPHRGMPFIGPPPMFYAAPDLHLREMLAKQIDYYFSPENLCKDIYLRQNMDEEGWVSISLIAGFNRVKNLTNSIQLILDTVRTSSVVEVQGDKIRRRNDWMNWPSLAAAPNPTHSSTILSHETLAAQVWDVKLEESTNQNSIRGATCVESVLGRSLSELNQSQVVVASSGKGKVSGQNTALTCSDQHVPARTLGRSDTF